MSLTEEDVTQVRDVIVSAIHELVILRLDEHDQRFDALESRLGRLEADIKAVEIDMRQVKSSLAKLDGRTEAMEADIKELYAMVAAQKPVYTDRKFAKLPVEQKLLNLYENFQLLAREAGVTLPNQPK
jgi:septal ring factor EnvC (AmiA/AmiB activator)